MIGPARWTGRHVDTGPPPGLTSMVLCPAMSGLDGRYHEHLGKCEGIPCHVVFGQVQAPGSGRLGYIVAVLRCRKPKTGRGNAIKPLLGICLLFGAKSTYRTSTKQTKRRKEKIDQIQGRRLWRPSHMAGLCDWGHHPSSREARVYSHNCPAR
jgi:hypothetical protein